MTGGKKDHITDNTEKKLRNLKPLKPGPERSKADNGLRSPDLADVFLPTFACNDRRKVERYRRQVVKRSAWAA